MGRAVVLWQDYKGSDLRHLAKISKNAGQSRRLLALAEIYDGGKRVDAARIGDVGLQVVRDWVLRFNADGPNGLIDRKAWGQPSKLNDKQPTPLHRVLKTALLSPFMMWSAGGSRIWLFGYLKSSAFRWIKAE